MKQFSLNIRWLILSLLLCVGSSASRADSYTINFANNASSATGISPTTNAETVIKDDGSRSYVTEKPFTINLGNCYYGDTKTCIRLGKSGSASSLTIALSSAGTVNATSITVNANNTGGKNNSNATLNVNDIGAQTTTTEASNYTFTLDGSSLSSITLAGSASVRVYSITVNYTTGGGSTAASTTTTIDASSITNTDIYEGTAAGSLSATVTSGGSAVSGATVTWSSSNENVATIASNGAVTLIGAGTTTITASYLGVEDEYLPSSATYELTVTNSDPNAPGTQNNPYTVAQARAAIDAGTGVTGVYATGIVSAIPTPYSTLYSNITFNFVDESDDEVFLQAYRCTGTDAADVQIGDIVVVYGTLTKYNSTYEFGQGCQLISLTHPASTQVATPTFSPVAGAVASGTTVSLSCPTEGASIYYTTDGTTPTTGSTLYSTPIAITAATTIKAIAVASGYTDSEIATAEYTIAVVNQLVTVDGEGNVTFLFNNTGWGLPEGTSSDAVSTVTTYTNSGYSIILGGGSPGHYYNASGMLMMGKSGAYLTLPAFDFDVDRIEVVGKSGASAAVIQNIFVGENAASTATTGATDTNLYNIDQDYQAKGNVYTLKVTSNHNTQITQIKVIKKSTNPSLSFSNASATVNVEGTYTQTVNAYNTGENTITYATSNAEIATVDASTGEVTGVTAGAVTITASVTVDGTLYTATYDITVQKNTPELSFATAVVSITESETYAGQTVTKPADINDAEITYSSNNAAVATVDASTGAITLAGGIGTATITATFAGNTKYNAATTTYTLKVTETGAASGDYVKVTSTSDLTDGEYLIVYEDGPLAFNGGLTTLDASGNTISVTLDTTTEPYKIASSTEVDAAAFTITAVTDGYTIANAAGNYIGWASSKNNGLTAGSTALVNTITFDESGNAVITGTGGRVLQYNSANGTGNLRFRYYSSESQQAIQLYKKSSSSVTIATPVISPETGTYTERPQTVTITCLTTPASGETLTIYYTTDGTTPTTSSSVYSAPFNISKNTTVQAIAVLNTGGTNVVSRVASSVITMSVNAPVFSPADGSTFSENYNVTISADAGLTIYYIAQDDKIFNTDAGGRTATASEGNGTLVSTALVYSSQLTFGQSMMVTAICVDADGNLSDPVTVKYTFTGSVVPPYYSSFSASEGDFTNFRESDENTITGNGAPEWKMNSNTGEDAIARWGEERYYMYVRGTSGNTVQNRTRWYGSAYLTSPIIDLTGKGSASFSFIHAAHHFYSDPNTSATVSNANLEKHLDDTKIPQVCKVQVGICDESGNVSTWTDIASTNITWPEQLFDPSKSGVSADGKSTTNASSRSGLFPRANSGDISLSEYEDQKIRIRFAYTSTPQNYGTWNIDQITVNAVDVEEMSMNSKGWTTYVFDHDIDAYATTQNYIDGGEETLKIYKVTEFDHQTCVLQQLGMNEDGSNDSERYIPAKTPVVIHGPASATINFVLHTAQSMLPTVKNNLLIASLSPNLAVAPAGSGVRYFVLQWNNSTNAPWFNKVSEGRSVPDHKAYLNGTDQVEAVSTTQSIKERGIYVIGGEEAGTATAIENVESTKGNVQGTIYNLSGQRVLNPTKGIYIVNGKKVLFK